MQSCTSLKQTPTAATEQDDHDVWSQNICFLLYWYAQNHLTYVAQSVMICDCNSCIKVHLTPNIFIPLNECAYFLEYFSTIVF